MHYTQATSKSRTYSILVIALSLFFVSELSAQTVSGTVYRDLDVNQLKSSGEAGVGSILITVYDASGASASATSSFDGSYSVNTSGLTGSDFRVEFTNLPSYLEDGFANPGASNTEVQFVSDGASDVDFMVNNPGDFCQNSPYLATGCYAQGDNVPNDSMEVVVTINYDDGHSGIFDPNQLWDTAPWMAPGAQKLAIANEAGTTFGEAWNPENNTLYMATMFRAHTGYGPGGQGAIYQVGVDPATGAATGDPSVFVDLAAAPFSRTLCTEPTHGIDLGDVNGIPQQDDTIMDRAGKCSMGDLEISDDRETLFVVNLAAKEIVAINVSDGSFIKAWPFPADQPAAECADSAIDFRPFALGYKDGVLYAGAVCTRQSTQDNGPMYLYFYSVDETAANGSSAAFNLEFSYDFRNFRDWKWNYWEGTWADDPRNWRPEPLLADIEWFGNDITLGFRDRNGDKLGDAIPNPLAPGQFIRVSAAGGLVCVHYDGTNYIVESDNNIAGGIATCGSRTQGAQGNEGGSDFVEFYYGDGALVGHPNGYHPETILGGLAQVNSRPVASTAINIGDVYGNTHFYSGGVTWLDNNDGSAVKGMTLYQTLNSDNPDWDPTTGKANGLGDLEALCVPAPIEIGNRVWCDDGTGGGTAGDGVQDPGEPGIGSVDVMLVCDTDGSGNIGDGSDKSATIATMADGAYLFTNAIWEAQNGPGMLIPNTTSCEVRVDRSDADLESACSVAPTAMDDGANDIHDSDGDNGALASGFSSVAFTTGENGQNDYSFDFGFVVADFGDLPDSYGTTGATTHAGGPAAHQIIGDCYLGPSVDAEGDGVASVNADGDDLTDDENGVTFNTPIIDGVPASVDVEVNEAGFLSCWMDFDGSGIFDADELITTSIGQAVTAGTETLSFTPSDVSNSAMSGIVYTRCRHTCEATNDVLAPTGISASGEVEDYVLMSLGGTIWKDEGAGALNDDGIRDNSELICGETCVALFEADGVTPIEDSNGDPVEVVTDASGNYIFSGLTPGDYVVKIPAKEFAIGGDLAGYFSSSPDNIDPDNDQGDGVDENGINGDAATDGISSMPITLAVGTEPTSASSGAGPDEDAFANSNLTVDFGVTQTPLPVELVDFNVEELDDRRAQLTWSTITEIENAGFSIQLSRDGNLYEEIGFVDGKGASSERVDYQFTTQELGLGVLIFRLKQVDFDGAYAYSENIQLSIEMVTDYVLDPAYPNPFNPSTSINYAVKEAQVVTLTMYNTTGNVVRTLFEGEVQANQMQTARVDGSDLASGTYLILLRGDDFVSTRTVILIK